MTSHYSFSPFKSASLFLLFFCVSIYASALVSIPAEGHAESLLDQAYAGVSKMPLQPHIKNRSRAQKRIVDSALELNNPDLASEYIQGIENWQRWLAKADLAYFYAQQRNVIQAQNLLMELDAVMKTAQDRMNGTILALAPNPLLDSLESWRFKQVNTRILETREVLNPGVIGAPESYDLSEAEIANLWADRLSNGTLDYRVALEQLHQMANTQDFEVLHPVMLGMVRLADSNYETLQIGDWAKQELVPRFKHTPVFVRVDVLRNLAEVALKHNDPVRALELCDTMETFIADARLPIQFYVEEMSKSLKLRIAAGQQEQAEIQLEKLRADFSEHQETVVSIYRAKSLCEMAEVSALSGNLNQALELYSHAVAAAQINPNARPQAEDLCTICCSMAEYGVAPSDALMADLNVWEKGLGRPW